MSEKSKSNSKTNKPEVIKRSEPSLSSSEIDNKVQYCITNLKILAKIQANNKLSYSEEKFYIDEWTWSQPTRRWWCESGRSTTIKNLENFIDSVFTTIDAIYNSECNDAPDDIQNSYYANITQKPEVFKEANSNILLQFSTEIINAIVGLSNLKNTYKSDISTISSLEIIIEKLNVRVKKIAGILRVHNTRSKKNCK
jgi:hypothetical protein